jgi:DNA-binding MarR family transcriptional regulator
MTTTQFGLLRTLERTGPVSLSALAQAAVYDRTTLNRLLKPVETAGLVEPGEGTDGRARIVQLSAAGKAMLNRAVPLWQAAQKAVEARLGGDLAQLHKLLDRIEELRA